MNRVFKTFISAWLAGVAVALLYFMFHEHLRGWKVLGLVVVYPVIFWLSQAVVDFAEPLIKKLKSSGPSR